MTNISRPPSPIPLLLKKALKESAALRVANAAKHVDSMVQSRVIHHVI
jgi:hypothetical protein